MMITGPLRNERIVYFRSQSLSLEAEYGAKIWNTKRTHAKAQGYLLEVAKQKGDMRRAKQKTDLRRLALANDLEIYWD